MACAAEVDALVAEFLPRLSEDVEIKKALFKECQRLYKQTLREALIRQTKERAERDAESLLGDISFDGVVMGPVNTELEDPNSYDGPMGRLLLEQRVLDLGLVEGGRILGR